MTEEPTVPLSLLTRALDEIYALRTMCAYEAQVRKVDLTYLTYPKSRREVAERRIKELQVLARGGWRNPLIQVGHASLKRALREAGASELLTRAQWEAEEGR